MSSTTTCVAYDGDGLMWIRVFQSKEPLSEEVWYERIQFASRRYDWLMEPKLYPNPGSEHILVEEDRFLVNPSEGWSDLVPVLFPDIEKLPHCLARYD